MASPATPKRNALVATLPYERIRHLYRPIALTLATALRYPPQKHNDCPRNVQITTSNVNATAAAAKLQAEDIFIWIGPTTKGLSSTVASLRARDVDTVYYNADPVNPRVCQWIRSLGFEEVWDYSRWNVDMCGREGTLMRYVPPGYIEPKHARRAMHATAAATTAAAAAASPQLVLFGYPYYSGRRGCYTRIVSNLGVRVNATWGVRNAAELARWWSSTGQYVLHLNLHKYCRAPEKKGLESVRLSMLLSRGAVVISQLAYEKDMHEYEGMVHFGSINALPGIFRSLWSSAPQATTSAGRTLRTSAEVAALFKRRFQPQDILERASVYDFLARRVHDR